MRVFLAFFLLLAILAAFLAAMPARATAPFNIPNGMTGKLYGTGITPGYSVLAAGAKCDGATDDTTAIQNAITTSAGLYTVVIPAGANYCLTGSLTVPSNSRIEVDGELYLKSGNNHSMFTINSGASNVQMFGHGTLYGNKAGQTGGQSGGIVNSGTATNIYINDLTVTDFQNWPVSLTQTTGAWLNNLTLSNSGSSPEFAEGTNNCWANQLTISDITDLGFAFYGGVYNCGISNSISTGNDDGFGVYNDTGQAAADHDISILGNIAYANTLDGIDVVNGPGASAVHTNIIVSGNDLYGNGTSGLPAQAGDIKISNAQHFAVTNNIMRGSGNSAIIAWGIFVGSQSAYGTIQGNTISNEGQGGTSGQGIEFSSSPTNLLVSGNQIFDDQATKTMQSAMSGIVGTGVQFLGNKLGPTIGTAFNVTNSSGDTLSNGLSVSGGALNVLGSANTIGLSGSSTGNPLSIAASGSDTNIGLTLTPKGTGAVQVAGSSLTLGTGPQWESVVCGGSADTGVVQTALNNLTSGISTILHGTCAITGALTPVTLNGVSATLAGDGIGSTTLNVANGEPGLAVTIENSASVTFQGMSLIRTQTSPAVGQTAITITAGSHPTTGVYGGTITLRDMFISGSTPGTYSWNTGLALNSVGQTLIDNVWIQGKAESTNTADTGVIITSPTAAADFTVGVQFQNSTVQGFGTGVIITGREQGISFINTGVLGDWQGINLNGIGPNVVETTTAPTTSGTSLQFAPGSLSSLIIPAIVNGTNIPVNDTVASFNNTTGVVVLTTAVTGTVASGANITFNNEYQQEALTVIYGSFNANDHDILCNFCAFASITNSNFEGPFGSNTNWVGIEFDNGDNNFVEDNPLISGLNSATFGYGILINNTGPSGAAPNIIMGNGLTGVGHCVGLKGTTVNTQVIGNSYECPVGYTQDAIGNQNFGNENTFGGVPFTPDITNNGASMTLAPGNVLDGTLVVNGDGLHLTPEAGDGSEFTLSADATKDANIFYDRLVSGTPTARWLWGMNNTAETGSNAGSDMALGAYSDAGSLIHEPLLITRSSGLITVQDGMNVSGGIVSTLSTATTPATGSVYDATTTLTGSVTALTAPWQVNMNYTGGANADPTVGVFGGSFNMTIGGQSNATGYALIGSLIMNGKHGSVPSTNAQAEWSGLSGSAQKEPPAGGYDRYGGPQGWSLFLPYTDYNTVPSSISGSDNLEEADISENNLDTGSVRFGHQSTVIQQAAGSYTAEVANFNYFACGNGVWCDDMFNVGGSYNVAGFDLSHLGGFNSQITSATPGSPTISVTVSNVMPLAAGGLFEGALGYCCSSKSTAAITGITASGAASGTSLTVSAVSGLPAGQAGETDYLTTGMYIFDITHPTDVPANTTITVPASGTVLTTSVSTTVGSGDTLIFSRGLKNVTINGNQYVVAAVTMPTAGSTAGTVYFQSTVTVADATLNNYIIPNAHTIWMFEGNSPSQQPDDIAFNRRGSVTLGCETSACSAVQLSGAALSLTGPLEVPKLATAPATAPGAGEIAIFAVAGTNAGTCKLQVQAGTSATPVTIVDNVGAGC